VDIRIEWQQPIQLTKFKKIIVDEKDLPETIEQRAGVYLFSRKHGKRYLPFYIGETLDIRGRLKGHLNWVKLVDVLRGMNIGNKQIKQGDRYFHYGYIITKPSQDKKKCIQIAQRHLIREAMSQKLPLLNIQLTAFPTHTLEYVGTKKSRAVFPKIADVPAD
jgi:hypothetical protein